MTTMTDQEQEKEELLTPDEVAEWLKVPPRTVADLIRAKKIPSIKIGRYRRVDPQALRDYIQQEMQRGG